jgi:hypothetical protein
MEGVACLHASNGEHLLRAGTALGRRATILGASRLRFESPHDRLNTAGDLNVSSWAEELEPPSFAL